MKNYTILHDKCAKKDELGHIGAYFLAVVDFRYNITREGNISKKKKDI